MASPQGSPAPVKDITTAEFMTEVVQASAETPVLVDFWAPWCGPCKQLAPALEAAVAATRGKVKLVKMNIDEHPEVAGQMGVQSIPAVFAFVNGKPVDGFMGAKAEGEIREFIARIAGNNDEPSQIDLMLEKAAEMAEAGHAAEASQIYGQILSVEPQNLKARAGIGRIYLEQGNMEGVKGVLAGLDENQMQDAEISGLQTAMELAEQAEALGDTSGLEQAVEAAPQDHDKRLELAVALNAANRREEAADHLLEIIRRQPGWNEDAARVQLLQFFEAWGMTDEATVTARRKLSSMLFS
ncbi:MAG: thioredoxin [Rhizobiaceae bacterium]|nr:thioredoxin [Rhizobiaceae bacterium]